MPSQNRFTQSGYWCRWGGLSSLCTHMDGNCIALRLCAMERPSEREKASPGGVSKYFRGKPPSASIVYHTPTPLSRVYLAFLKNFFERVLSHFATPLLTSLPRPPSPSPLIPLSRAFAAALPFPFSDSPRNPFLRLSTTTAITLCRSSLCVHSRPLLPAAVGSLFNPSP